MSTVSLSCWRRRALALSIAAALSPACVLADESDDADRLDEVVVTASRVEQPLSDVLAATTVFTREDIERLQPVSLHDLLRGTPGVSLTNSGGPGKQTSLSLRGTEYDHVLFLIDGVRMGSATAGAPAFQDIPLEHVERVEIVRGPVSSLYGADAVGGVIQVFTRRPDAPFSPEVGLGYGSHDSYKGHAATGGRGDAGWYALRISHEETDGINSCRGDAATFAGCYTWEPDHDGYRNRTVSVRGGVRIGDAWEAEANVLRVDGRNEYDGTFTNEVDLVQQSIGATLRHGAGRSMAWTFSAGQGRDEADDFLDGVWMTTFNTRRDQAAVQGDFVIGQGRLSLGADWRNDKVESSTPYDIDERDNLGVFGQWQQALGAHRIQVSARHDDDEQFGGKTTGTVAWGWDFTGALRLSAAWGSAFKAPAFNDLYYPGFGNPALVPESSRSLEVGLRGRHGWGGWSVNAFDSRIEDLIAYDGNLFIPDNIDRARIKGVELAADTALAGWDLRASANWLDPRNDSGGAAQDNFLPRRPRHSGRLDIDRRFADIGVGATVAASAERYDNVANTRRLGGFATTDLRVAWWMTADWSLRLTANNVFNRRYETVEWYQQPGFNWMLALRWQPVR